MCSFTLRSQKMSKEPPAPGVHGAALSLVAVFVVLLGFSANLAITDTSILPWGTTGKLIKAIFLPRKYSVTSTRSVPNNPSTIKTEDSFKNYEEGSQVFQDTTFDSPQTIDSFNNLESGQQSFKNTEIRSGDQNSETVNSFRNEGKGSQTFDGFKLNQIQGDVFREHDVLE